MVVHAGLISSASSAEGRKSRATAVGAYTGARFHRVWTSEQPARRGIRRLERRRWRRDKVCGLGVEAGWG